MSKSKKPGHYLSDAIKDGQGSSIYISYCRKDKSFVKALYDGLTVDGREVFVEWEDVAAAASEAEQFEEIKESMFFGDYICYIPQSLCAMHSVACARSPPCLDRDVVFHRRCLHSNRH